MMNVVLTVENINKLDISTTFISISELYIHQLSTVFINHVIDYTVNKTVIFCLNIPSWDGDSSILHNSSISILGAFIPIVCKPGLSMPDQASIT